MSSAQVRAKTQARTHTHTHSTANDSQLGCCWCCCCRWHSNLCRTFFNILARNALKFVARRINAASMCACPTLCLSQCVWQRQTNAPNEQQKGGTRTAGEVRVWARLDSSLADWHTHTHTPLAPMATEKKFLLRSALQANKFADTKTENST